MASVKGTFASPTADAASASYVTHMGVMQHLAANMNIWTVLLTALCIAVVYDQFSYKLKKGSIEGPSWKIPFIGPFLESVNPEMDKYKAKWASGPLSCVSVFHK